MRWPTVLIVTVAVSVSGLALRAQMPTYGLGRVPTPEEIRAADDVVGPYGRELRPGSGTAQEGAAIYARRCVFCHGVDGRGVADFPALVGETLHPFATTYWSIINNSMPRMLPAAGLRDGTLATDEVYALTAWILFQNGIIQEETVMNAETLSRVRMPTRDRRLDGWAPPASN